MEKELVAKWTTALRSGDYTQAHQQLRGDRLDGKEGWGYCCLGVLADIVAPDGWEADNSEFHNRGDGGELDREMLDEIGMTVEQQNLLVRMNDGGTPFEAIAILVEATFLK